LIAASISIFVWLSSVHSILKFDWKDMRSALRKSLLVAIASGIAPACAFLLCGAHPQRLIPPLTIGVTGAGIGFLLSAYAVNHPLLAELRRIVPVLRKMLGMRREN
jgi:hypothetical protein